MGKIYRGTICLALVGLVGCAGKRMTIETDVPGQVAIVPLDDLSAQGEVAGKTPVTVEIDKFKGKLLRISSTGKIPFYVINATNAGQATTAKFKFEPVPIAEAADTPGAGPLTPQTLNRVQKLMIRAYQALAARDYESAKGLADKAATLAPLLAAPYIIIGMAGIDAGKKSEANAALQKAKALDPEDAEIDELLQLVK